MDEKTDLRERRFQTVLLLAGLFLGMAVRVAAFRNYLPGLNQDEASSGYEAWSLWHTGFDRWGEVRWPVYFTAWGSGQNVLLSYLIAPLVGLFGMSSFTVRILPFLLSLASIPLVYALTRRVLGVGAALTALWLFALSPWHTMVSAWALESNLLPFFLALTLLFLEKWRARPDRLRWLAAAGTGAALCLYAYALAVLVLPLLALFYATPYLVALWNEKRPRRALGAVVSLLPGFVLASPFLLFLIKNHVVHGDLGFERWLPFGLQLLPVTRLAQVEEQAAGGVLPYNLSFVAKAFDDGALWNTLPGHKPFLWVSLFFALLQLGFLGAAAMRRRKENPWPFLWCLASLPLFVTTPLNVNRANALWIPLLCVAAQGIFSFHSSFSRARVRAAILTLAASAVVGEYSWFFRDYVTRFPRLTRDYLRYHMPEALGEVELLRREAGVSSVYVSPKAFWGYLYIAFHRQMPPADFRESRETIRYRYHADRLGDFFFSKAMLDRHAPAEYVFLFYKDEKSPCDSPRSVKVYENWQLGVCRLAP